MTPLPTQLISLCNFPNIPNNNNNNNNNNSNNNNSNNNNKLIQCPWTSTALSLKRFPYYGILPIDFWLVVTLLFFSVDSNIGRVGADGGGEADVYLWGLSAAN